MPYAEKMRGQFEWTNARNEAFVSPKTALAQPVLAFADFSRKFYIRVDASNFAVHKQ